MRRLDPPSMIRKVFWIVEWNNLGNGSAAAPSVAASMTVELLVSTDPQNFSDVHGSPQALKQGETVRPVNLASAPHNCSGEYLIDVIASLLFSV